MSDSTIRRSIATLGVVAGLLAAAVPASAAGVPAERPTMTPAALGTQVGSEGVKAPADCGFTEGNGQPMSDDHVQTKQASLGRENSIECLVRLR